MKEKIHNFLLDEKFKLILKEKFLYISNYQKIISLEYNYVSMMTNNKKIKIYGEKLSLKKVLENELLIKGKINKIEVEDDR